MRRIDRTADYPSLRDAAKQLGLTVPPATQGDVVVGRSAAATGAAQGAITYTIADDHLPALKALIDHVQAESGMTRQSAA